MKLVFGVNKDALERVRRRTPELMRRFIDQTGEAVETEAIAQLKSGPNRANAEGNLIDSIGNRVVKRGGTLYAEVYATAPYAEFVHEGTGIYGPKRQPIRPVKAKALRFEIGGEVLFRRSVKGMRPRPFFRAAVKLVVPHKMAKIFKRVTGETLFKK